MFTCTWLLPMWPHVALSKPPSASVRRYIAITSRKRSSGTDMSLPSFVMEGSVRRRWSISMFTLSGTAWRKKRWPARSASVVATHAPSASPPHASSCSHSTMSSASAVSSSSQLSSTNTHVRASSASSGSSANAGLFAFCARKTSSAAPSKYSIAVACSSAPRTAIVNSTASASPGKKQLAPHTSTGTGKSASSSSQITPSVPHAPMNRSIASMSSHAK